MKDLGIALVVLAISLAIYTICGFVACYVLSLAGINIAVNLYTSFLVGIAFACLNGMKNSLFPVQDEVT